MGRSVGSFQLSVQRRESMSGHAASSRSILKVISPVSVFKQRPVNSDHVWLEVEYEQGKAVT